MEMYSMKLEMHKIRYQMLRFFFIILTCVIPAVCWKTNGELISVRKHNYGSMLDDGIY